ncbi:MAG: hypothetical protein Q7W30_06425 [Coriobacteriia bacterium]|nr:hypothetical protein [Coriobacteriia bacterium]
MSTRSPHNDRYKTDPKGKTRKSASAAKPKRAVGASTPATKKPAKKKSLWGRGPAPAPVAPLVQTPAMKKLRRLWWILWAASLGIAIIIVALPQFTQLKAVAEQVKPVLWGLWAAAMGGAFYLEFGPIRKARIEAIELSKKKPKERKADAKAKADADPKVETADDASGDE